MTMTDIAIAKLIAAQDALDPIAREADNARAAYKRSKSKANIARLVAAQEAFEAALAVCDACHDAVDAAEVTDAVIAAQAAKAADAYAQPTLF